MKQIILLFILTSYAFSWANDNNKTVENLETQRYMGKWYEIASIPQSFQKDCVKNTTAEYELQEDQIQVINSCTKEDGSLKSTTGRARLNPDFNENSKLEVSFVKIFGAWVWSFGGDYWVLDLSKNYQWSIVGDPDREYLWILSRKPVMSDKQIKTLRKSIEAFGYDTCEVLLSRSDANGLKKRVPLCEI